MNDQTKLVSICEDMDLTEKHNFIFKQALQQHTGRSFNGSCEGFRLSCQAEKQVLLRFACPVTCGCRSPISGLFFNGPDYGCPREQCQGTVSYQDELRQRSCED